MQQVFLAICASTGVVFLRTDAARADDATITIVRPGACSAQENRLSTKTIIPERAIASAQDATARRPISVIRSYPSGYENAVYENKGWAAERLLQRFDLQTTKKGIQIINTSPFCVEER